MHLKVSKLAYYTMPALLALSLAACGHHHHGKDFDPEAMDTTPAKLDVSGEVVDVSDIEVATKDGFVYVSVLDTTGETIKVGDEAKYDMYWWDCGDSKPVGTTPGGGYDDFPYDTGITWEIKKSEKSDATVITYAIPVKNFGNFCGVPRKYDGTGKVGDDGNKLLGGTGNFETKFTNDSRTKAAKLGEVANEKNTQNTLAELVATKAGFNLEGARAHFIDEKTLSWIDLKADPSNVRIRLYSSKDPKALIALGSDGSIQAGSIDFDKGSLTAAQKAIVGNFLNDATTFTVRTSDNLKNMTAKEALSGQLVAVAVDSDGNVVDQTKVQSAFAIDAVYGNKAFASEDALGATVNSDGSVTYRVFAPTAAELYVHIFKEDCLKDKNPACELRETDPDILLTKDEDTGIWSGTAKDAANMPYKYSLTVYHPEVDDIKTLWTTDPYSLGLARNSDMSVAVDLSADGFAPDGWDNDKAPVSQKTDSDIANMSIMETHIRDLTVGHTEDADVAGKYIAFEDNNITNALEKLADNGRGITHMEILPFYDFSTVNENPDKVADITMSGAKFCENLNNISEDLKKTLDADVDNAKVCSADVVTDHIDELAAADSAKLFVEGSYTLSLADHDLKRNINGSKVDTFLNTYVKGNDSYNWGYDPWHYGVPEGSYSTDPSDPATRTKEARTMVKAIHDAGMNIVMDVVYNHTDGAGVNMNDSVLDKLVPWYYNRLDSVSGEYLANTCCKDSAPEHKMFERLMTDTLVTWAKDYHIDAFRFDLMGYIPRAVMVRTLDAVREKSGNSEVYFFGEGWDAETNGDRFVKPTQLNIAGTKIGTFNDRIRDGLRGVGPFDHGYTQRERQSFSTGKCTLHNELIKSLGNYTCDPAESNERDWGVHPLLWEDIIRVSMAGNLKDYAFTAFYGEEATGETLHQEDGGQAYWGKPAGYAASPLEVINYVSKHDNQTIYDMIVHRAPTGLSDEILMKMQAISLATVFFGQTPAFDQHGSYALRTKFFENDSYNTGDYSNWTPLFGDVHNRAKGADQDVVLVNFDKDKDDWGTVIYNTLLPGSNVKKSYSIDTTALQNTYLNMLNLRRDLKDFVSLGDASKIKNQVKFLNTGTEQVPGVIAMAIDGAGSTIEDDDGGKVSAVLFFLNAGNKNSEKAGITLQKFDAAVGKDAEAVDWDLGPADAAEDRPGVFAEDECEVENNDGKLTVKSPAWSVCVFFVGDLS